MEENFSGYFLNALDPETERQVEAYLRENPDANAQMDLIRQALEPLEADMAEIDPPANLAERTLARVAEYSCHDLPRAPVERKCSGGRPRWWRRADMLVAASIVLCIGLLVPPVVVHLQREHERVSCENNLGPRIGLAMIRYADQHRGAFPNVADPKLTPRDVCGMSLPLLVSSGVVDKDGFSIRCPGNGGPAQCGWTADQVLAMSEEEFKEKAPRLSGCYSYTMGYYDHGRVEGFTRDSFPVPLMADRPPFRARGRHDNPGNSPNHGGAGQNVLFTDGHVAFLTNRTFRGDDIYLNRENDLAPGKDPSDIVLGPSEARTRPLD
jgi:prepilin-type processing-associated H-X9-DG protein